jgi:D-3-phosphoglycerate dehydrogenase / 2-oxoglutarate reductase
MTDTILITDLNFGEPDLEREIAAAGGFELAVADCRSAEDVIEAASRIRPVALLVQYAPITRKTLDACPSVRVVGRYGAGLDGIDLAAAAERSVAVVNVPEYGTDAVADHALALLLAVVRGLPQWTTRTRGGRWPPPTAVPPSPELAGHVLGLFGFGRIGRALAVRCHALGMRVIAHDPYVEEGDFGAHDVRAVTRDELWAQSAVVSLHAPLTEETSAVMDGAAFARLHRGAYVINTARAGLIDREALEQALADGQVESVGLDVWWEEPPRRSDALLRHPRVVVTPHVAWWSRGAIQRLRTRAVRRVVEAVELSAPVGREVR